MTRPAAFDVVVIGSGASGGWAAKKLTESGLRVALIEAGRDLVPERDFTEHEPPYALPQRDFVVPRKIREEQRIQSTSYVYSAYNHSFFVRDTENPYRAPDDRPFRWIRSRQTGGKTTLWSRVCLRFSDADLKAASNDGHGIDWPISYADLAPYYDEVERFIGVNGTPLGLSHVPDGRYQPAMQLSCGEQLFKKTVEEKFGRKLAIAPSAVLTQGLPGRAPCHYCGPCERGCTTRSFFSSGNSTLPAAAATGRLTLFPNTIVREVLLGKNGRARAVACVESGTRRELEIEGRVIALCASTLESTRILLSSKSAAFPDGLGNSSGVLGRYLMDHLSVYVGFRHLPQLRGVVDAPGRRPTSFFIPRFRNVGRKDAPFLRGYSFQGVSHDTGRVGHAYGAPGFGVKLKQALEHGTPEWFLVLLGFGECLPWADNRATIDPDTKDAWGIPSLRIEMAFRANERAMAEDMLQTGAEMLDAAAAPWGRPPINLIPGSSVHEVGTARMGQDPRTSFLNGWNQSHAVPNLFVLDGAAFPSSPCQNPTLTIMALAARASDYMVSGLKRGVL